jgi:salicylate hydroxylase
VTQNLYQHIVMYPILQGRYINTIQFISDPSKEGTHLSGPMVVHLSEDDRASMYAGWEDDVQCVVKVRCLFIWVQC